MYLKNAKKNKDKGDVENMSILPSNDTERMLFGIELVGILIGVYFLLKCEHNIYFNIFMFIFSPWLFILYSYYANSCHN